MIDVQPVTHVLYANQVIGGIPVMTGAMKTARNIPVIKIADIAQQDARMATTGSHAQKGVPLDVKRVRRWTDALFAWQADMALCVNRHAVSTVLNMFATELMRHAYMAVPLAILGRHVNKASCYSYSKT